MRIKKELKANKMNFELHITKKKWRTLVKIWGMTDAPI